MDEYGEPADEEVEPKLVDMTGVVYRRGLIWIAAAPSFHRITGRKKTDLAGAQDVPSDRLRGLTL